MDRAQFFARLEQEAVLAEGIGDTVRTAELRARIRRASAGSAVPPARETTAASRPARSRS
jgi:hypothetical protein